jgi:hypothetical protein
MIEKSFNQNQDECRSIMVNGDGTTTIGASRGVYRVSVKPDRRSSCAPKLDRVLGLDQD